ncbi:MAG: sulfate transporter permease subunit CysT [Fibrobacterota bacterium]
MGRSARLPGFGLTMGVTVTWLSLIVLIPLAGLFAKSATIGIGQIYATLSDERVLSAFRVSFGAALVAALINAILGPIVAWTLVRYEFPGKRIVDGLVDVPFALPTAVAGITLTTLYAQNGWFGQILTPLGIEVAYTWKGIVAALVFIGLPFVVRTVQPVLEEIPSEVEEAAASMGATRLQTIRRVILPALYPAILTGFTLAFARAVGEYGSVVFIAGNMPLKTEILPLVIITKLEQYQYGEATAVASAMLLVSFAFLLLGNVMQGRLRRRKS